MIFFYVFVQDMYELHIVIIDRLLMYIINID